MNILRSKTCEKYDIIPEKTWKYRYSWEKIYEVRIGGHVLSAFLVVADCDQDAIDALLDYFEEENKYPGLWSRYEDEYIQELIADAKKDGREDDMDYVYDFYIQGGNSGIFLHDPYQTIEIERIL